MKKLSQEQLDLLRFCSTGNIASGPTIPSLVADLQDKYLIIFACARAQIVDNAYHKKKDVMVYWLTEPMTRNAAQLCELPLMEDVA